MVRRKASSTTNTRRADPAKASPQTWWRVKKHRVLFARYLLKQTKHRLGLKPDYEEIAQRMNKRLGLSGEQAYTAQSILLRRKYWNTLYSYISRGRSSGVIDVVDEDRAFRIVQRLSDDDWNEFVMGEKPVSHGFSRSIRRHATFPEMAYFHVVADASMKSRAEAGALLDDVDLSDMSDLEDEGEDEKVQKPPEPENESSEDEQQTPEPTEDDVEHSAEIRDPRMQAIESPVSRSADIPVDIESLTLDAKEQKSEEKRVDKREGGTKERQERKEHVEEPHTRSLLQLPSPDDTVIRSIHSRVGAFLEDGSITEEEYYKFVEISDETLVDILGNRAQLSSRAFLINVKVLIQRYVGGK